MATWFWLIKINESSIHPWRLLQNDSSPSTPQLIVDRFIAHLDVTSYSDPRDTIDKSAVNDST